MAHHSVLQNSKGMSLIEVMIAILLLFVVSVALMQTSLLGFQQNMRNSMREEAVRIADQMVGDLRARAFTQEATDPVLNVPVSHATVTRNLRSFQAGFVTRTTITDISTQVKQVAVEVKWDFKGSTFSHTTNAILGKK